jgi:hypothetical protein
MLLLLFWRKSMVSRNMCLSDKRMAGLCVMIVGGNLRLFVVSKNINTGAADESNNGHITNPRTSDMKHRRVMSKKKGPKVIYDEKSRCPGGRCRGLSQTKPSLSKQ